MNYPAKEKIKALVVVAHPDDETIWMGGTLAKFKNINWMIFSLCRASDLDRAPKFLRACQNYGVKALITDLEDEGRLGALESVPIIKRIIQEKIKNKNFDFIFTHGKNGEYGHPLHRGVHLAIFSLIKEKKLRAKAVFYFNYKRKNKKLFSSLVAKKNSNILVKLSAKEFADKKGVMIKIYGFAKKGIDVNYCQNPEAFQLQLIDK